MNTFINIQDEGSFNSPLGVRGSLNSPLETRGPLFSSTPTILVGMGTCGIGNGADLVFERLRNYKADTNAGFELKQTGCFGFCAEEPLVMLYQPGKPMLVYSKVDEKDAVHIAESVLKGKVYRKKLLCRIDEWDFHTSKLNFGKGYEDIPHWNEIPFFKGQ